MIYNFKAEQENSPNDLIKWMRPTGIKLAHPRIKKQ